MFGKILQINPNPKGYTQVVIIADTPYKREFLKFNIWSVKRIEGIEEGSTVKFSYNKEGRFLKLREIELAVIGTCFTCYAMYELQDAQQLSCTECHTGEQRDRIAGTLKLTTSSVKQYTYSNGISLTFVDEEDTRFITCVFQNSPLFDNLLTLDTNAEYKVTAWKTTELDDGDGFFMDLIDVPEE